MDLGVVFTLLDEFRAHCYRALRLSDSAERDGNGTETQEIGINCGKCDMQRMLKRFQLDNRNPESDAVICQITFMRKVTISLIFLYARFS